MSAATTKPTAPAKPDAMKQAQAKLAAKREAEQGELDELRRDVPPGIEIEEALKAAYAAAERKPPVNLYAAIHKAQAKIETVRKNGENPHFKSKYATLDEVWETVRKAVNDAGLVVFCTIDPTADGKKELTTHVAEVKSGEEISCSFPIVAQAATPQAVGSAMTYARRYTLTALLEIVTGDGADDDGEAATNHNTPATKNPSASAAADALGF